MAAELPCNSLDWYVVHTNSRQEERADSNLKAWGVETFLPKIKVSKNNRYSNQTTYEVKPLFPRYLFARFELDLFFHKIKFTRGVHSIVNFSGKPIPVTDSIIDTIKSRTSDDHYVCLEDQLKQGDEVRVNAGGFKNFIGVFERKIKDSDRVIILLNTIGYQAHLEVEGSMVMKVGA